MKQKKIDNQIADIVNKIIQTAYNVEMWNRGTIEEYFTEKIGEIYSRGYDDGVNSERSGRNYK